MEPRLVVVILRRQRQELFLVHRELLLIEVALPLLPLLSWL